MATGYMALLAREYGMTVLLTTHFMDEADALCNRVAIMNLGRIAAEGSPEDLKQSIERPDATLDEVFAHYTGHSLEIEHEGNYRDISQTRNNLARLS